MFKKTLFLALSASLTLAFFCSGSSLFYPFAIQAAEISFQPEPNGDVTVNCDEKLFTRYILNSKTKPVLYPVIGPGGQAMTRQYPFGDALPNEKADHPHQRSVWFSHGDVNGLSFWHEPGSFGKKEVPFGTIKHVRFNKCDGNTIIAENQWLDMEGNVLLSETREITFAADNQTRWFDWTSTITAQQDEVTLGDTKEGTFGVRVAGTMKVSEKLGGKIVNSEGLTDDNAWGKPAKWVDYSGPVDGKTVGIAIFNHPTSYGFPTHWHVRTYGLFAANPFGLHDFYGKDSGKNGAVTLKKGEALTFKYRVVLHSGDAEQSKIGSLYDGYIKENVIVPERF